MKPRSQKLIASWVALLGLAVLLGGGVALKELAVERWFLWKLEGEDEEARRLAARKLAAMGSRAAIPILVEIFRQEHDRIGDPGPSARTWRLGLRHTQHYSMEALIGIGPLAVPAIGALLTDEEVLVRENTAFCLGAGTPLGRDLIATLAETSKDQNTNVRRAAGGALVRMGRPAIPVLIEALGDERAYVRAETPMYLAAFGSEANSAVPALIKNLGDENMEVRVNSACALGIIAPGYETVVEALVGRLKDSQEVVRCVVARILGEMGPRAAGAASALRDLLADDHQVVRDAATAALAVIERGSRDRPVFVSPLPVLESDES